MDDVPNKETPKVPRLTRKRIIIIISSALAVCLLTVAGFIFILDNKPTEQIDEGDLMSIYTTNKDLLFYIKDKVMAIPNIESKSFILYISKGQLANSGDQILDSNLSNAAKNYLDIVSNGPQADISLIKDIDNQITLYFSFYDERRDFVFGIAYSEKYDDSGFIFKHLDKNWYLYSYNCI